MYTWGTMTISGIYGSPVVADTLEEAIKKAEAIGEVVLDATDVNGEHTLIVAE
jgi:hypothetical protein